ncbi:MAG TPA: VOC family protein [Azospira sp.]|nr:VOC family protein [Azospira sp.]
MPRCCIDHLTVTAPTLAAGTAFVRDALGVDAQPGGEHPRMGTHNRLLRLGDALFLEIIAANPAAAAPGRPRWFALDTLAADAAPTLATWVARTDDIGAAHAAASEPLGNIEPMSRGALDWLITIPADGALPLDGAGPALIEWHTASHPASGLVDHGLSLLSLEIFHPQPERVSRLLQSLRLDGPLVVSAGPTARLVAHIDTPAGKRRLGG